MSLGKAIKFEGYNTNKYGTCSTASGLPIGTSNWTVELWLTNLGAITPGFVVQIGDALTEWGSITMQTNNPNTSYFAGGAYGHLTNLWSYSYDTWYYWVMTYDGTTIKNYINAVNTPAYDVTPPSALNITGTWISCGIGPPGTWLASSHNGRLDGVRVYKDKVLSQGEITALYRGGSPNAQVANENCVAWYKFDDNADDSSGNSSNLSLTGAPSYEEGILPEESIIADCPLLMGSMF